MICCLFWVVTLSVATEDFILVNPYIQHTANPHDRFSGPWIEFEANHPTDANFYTFESVHPEKVRADLIQSSILDWTDESIGENPREWERQWQREIEERRGRNLGKVAVYRRADRIASLPPGSGEQYGRWVREKVNEVCLVPPSQVAPMVQVIRDDFALEIPREESAKKHGENCQWMAQHSGGNVLSRWYSEDFTALVREYGNIATHHPPEDRQCALTRRCSHFVEFQKMATTFPITLKIFHKVKSFVEKREGREYGEDAVFLDRSDHFQVQERLFLPRPQHKIYRSTLGVGGGNSYEFFFVENSQGELDIVYADDDGTLLHTESEFHLDNFREYWKTKLQE